MPPPTIHRPSHYYVQTQGSLADDGSVGRQHLEISCNSMAPAGASLLALRKEKRPRPLHSTPWRPLNKAMHCVLNLAFAVAPRAAQAGLCSPPRDPCVRFRMASASARLAWRIRSLFRAFLGVVSLPMHTLCFDVAFIHLNKAPYGLVKGSEPLHSRAPRLFADSSQARGACWSRAVLARYKGKSL